LFELLPARVVDVSQAKGDAPNALGKLVVGTMAELFCPAFEFTHFFEADGLAASKSVFAVSDGVGDCAGSKVRLLKVTFEVQGGWHG